MACKLDEWLLVRLRIGFACLGAKISNLMYEQQGIISHQLAVFKCPLQSREAQVAK